MAYSGYLIKIGDYIVPADKYIKADSYTIYQNTQDLDSYRDTNGVLHRFPLAHVPLKVEWETPAMLTNTEFATMMSNIQANFTDSTARKASTTLYVPELDKYITQDMYMSDPKPEIYGTYGGVIHYNAVRFAMIGY